MDVGIVTAKIDEIGYITDATCLSGAPEELAEKVRALERAGLSQIMLYPPLNRQYRVIEDFADKVMARL